MNNCMLTTFDNPFNPFEDFVSWFQFDTANGYNSCARLARIANVTEDLSEKEVAEEVERAIDQIVKYDDLNVYTKLTKHIEESEEDDDLTE